VDAYEDLGPVAGILSALESDPGANWLVIACDLPNVDDTTIAELIENASAEHAFTAYRSVRDDLPEPLCAIYTPQSRDIIRQFIADGVKCPRKMLIKSSTHLLVQPKPGALHNVNTPDDLVGTDIQRAS
jgi:molybdopterin-guanine dinucleotide biosynthesis protein A